jgi:Ca2+-binding EF-hand superfamily protein
VIQSYSVSQNEGAKWQDMQFEKFPMRKISFTQRELNEINNQKYILEVSQNEARIIELFNQYDEDGSGELDSTEFAQLLNEFGISCSEEEGKAIIASVDTDGNSHQDIRNYRKNDCSFRFFIRKKKEVTTFPICRGWSS